MFGSQDERPIRFRKQQGGQDTAPSPQTTPVYADIRPLHANLEELTEPKERVYFTICAILSALLYLALIPTLFISGWILFIPSFLLASLISHGLMIGHIRGNGVRVSHEQFPELAAATERICHQMNIPNLPPVYILESGGILNALTTRFLSKDFVILYSRVVELAEEQGEEALHFVLAHELAHVKRGHIKWRWVILPSMMIPLLNDAYYRACEYTCDKMAAHCAPKGAIDGLAALAVGTRLYKRVNPKAFIRQVHQDGGFWTRFAELFSTHPNLSKRLQRVQSLPFVS